LTPKNIFIIIQKKGDSMTQLAKLGGHKTVTETLEPWPRVDLKRMEEAVLRVLHSKKWGSLHGDETKKFAEEFAAYQDSKYCIPCSSGTTALRIALSAQNIDEGDEIIMPGYTFIATATAALELRAIPIFVDIHPDTYTIDPDKIEEKITPRTKAIMPVHIGGRPADMNAINRIAEKHRLFVIEDAAQGWGASYDSVKVGSLGNCGCFSFQSSKNLTSAEGGAITTNNQDLAELLESWTNCGRKKDGIWYAHYLPAGNNRITEFQTALLRAQLNEYPEALEIRQNNAKYLDKRIKEIPGLTSIPFSEKEKSSIHFYIIKYQANHFDGLDREKWMEAVKAEGIFCHSGYSLPVYQQPIFKEKSFFPGMREKLEKKYLVNYSQVSLAETEKACQEESVWLPQWLLYSSNDFIKKVADGIEKVCVNYKELL